MTATTTTRSVATTTAATAPSPTPAGRRPGRRWRSVTAAALTAGVAYGVATGCTAPPLTTDVVTLAAAQEGKPYVYGAAGPNSFDCSGLVQYVFRQAGRTMPRTAQQQYDATWHIYPGQAHRGDLVFWGAPTAVYHVGIYIGNNQMIAAPHTGTNVRQETVWSGASYGRPLV